MGSGGHLCWEFSEARSPVCGPAGPLAPATVHTYGETEQRSVGMHFNRRSCQRMSCVECVTPAVCDLSVRVGMMGQRF